MPSPGQATAAATSRTSAQSVVMAPGASPVEKIMALMAVEPKETPAAPAPAPQPAEAPAPDTPAEPVETPAPAEEPNQPVEQEASQPESDSPVREIPLDELEAIELDVTTKGEDGRDVTRKLTIKELRAEHMMQRDYSRKTDEVARQREAIPEEIRKGVENERAAYFSTLQSLQEMIVSSMDAELKTVNWKDLAENDPATYVRLDNRRKEMDRTLGEITSKQQELIQRRKTERAQAQDEQARKSWDVLEKKIPGWDNTKYQTLMKAAQDFGYKPDEVSSWVDHRAFEVLHDALEYRKLKSQKKPDAPVATKKVVVVPKAVTPGAATPTNAAKQNRHSEAMKQLQSKGTVESAAAVIKARMG